MKDRIEELARRIGSLDIRTEAYYRYAYNYDATGRHGDCDAVVFPRGLTDLVSILREASRLSIPSFVRGAGTGFSGGSVPQGGGIVISTEKIRKILRLEIDSARVEVEAGLVNRKLQDFLAPRGWFYPPDPASMNVSTIGGNIAENAGGPRAYKYGVTRRYIRSLTWITTDGEVIESPLEGPAALIPGSEGTLGVLYSAVLSIVPLPVSYKASIVKVPGDIEAMETASELLSTGLCPGVLEFIDAKTMECVSGYQEVELFDSRGSYLFFEIDGSHGEVMDQQKILDSFISDKGYEILTAENEKEREILWELRRSISPSLARRGITKVNEDISLPLGKLKDIIGFIETLASELRLDCYLFGHCGDGNLHVNIMTDRRRADEMRRTEVFVERLFSKVVELRGTLSGEHGIGITKNRYLEMLFSQDELRLQKQIKNIFDNGGTLNPGKYFSS
ncbi:MAG: FAD-binding protein [Candidatus Krumholzibacteriota bacterium]|nr:FAD-binding protein [Candidatus Krumholzibacteriota bacterium]